MAHRPPHDVWPVLSPGRRLYCIGDIHGRLDLLDGVLRRINADLTAAPANDLMFLFLGDYLDRGPDSAGVIDRLVALSGLVPTVFLKGNHEAVLIDVLWHPLLLPSWGAMGGYATLLSYGLTPPLHPSDRDCFSLAEALLAALPESHRAFLESLRPLHQDGDYLFVHAGIDPSRPLHQQEERDLLWIRDPFLSAAGRHAHFVVHGHTPVREPDIRPNRINIDTGAYASGRLTCLVLEGGQLRFV